MGCTCQKKNKNKIYFYKLVKVCISRFKTYLRDWTKFVVQFLFSIMVGFKVVTALNFLRSIRKIETNL